VPVMARAETEICLAHRSCFDPPSQPLADRGGEGGASAEHLAQRMHNGCLIL